MSPVKSKMSEPQCDCGRPAIFYAWVRPFGKQYNERVKRCEVCVQKDLQRNLVVDLIEPPRERDMSYESDIAAIDKVIPRKTEQTCPWASPGREPYTGFGRTITGCGCPDNYHEWPPKQKLTCEQAQKMLDDLRAMIESNGLQIRASIVDEIAVLGPFETLRVVKKDTPQSAGQYTVEYQKLDYPKEAMGRIRVGGQRCAYLTRRIRESGQYAMYCKVATTDVDIPMFEVAAYPSWKRKEAHLHSRAMLKATAAVWNEQTRQMQFLEQYFYEQFGCYPTQCVVPYSVWDTVIPADPDINRTGFILYRNIGLAMLG